MLLLKKPQKYIILTWFIAPLIIESGTSSILGGGGGDLKGVHPIKQVLYYTWGNEGGSRTTVQDRQKAIKEPTSSHVRYAFNNQQLPDSTSTNKHKQSLHSNTYLHSYHIVS